MKDKGAYIIAEVGPNHNGDLNIALSMIKDLASAGVDAVKFQISKPENAYSRDAFKPSYQKENERSDSPLKMSKRFQLPFEDHVLLSDTCGKYGVDYLCTAFEMESLKFLDENTNMPYFKIPSGEILTLDMLEYISQRRKPILLSTGMASYKEMETAFSILSKNGNMNITILHCISNYPTPAQDVNLNVMLEIRRRFETAVGFSDHTLGNDAAVAAVALGASVVEKHVTFDKDAEGPDHKASATIGEFTELVRSIRNVEAMMGASEKVLSEQEREIKRSVRKSIVTVRSLPRGHVIRKEDLCFKRPGTGFYPTQLDQVLGRALASDLEADRVILKDHLG